MSLSIYESCYLDLPSYEGTVRPKVSLQVGENHPLHCENEIAQIQIEAHPQSNVLFKYFTLKEITKLLSKLGMKLGVEDWYSISTRSGDTIISDVNVDIKNLDVSSDIFAESYESEIVTLSEEHSHNKGCHICGLKDIEQPTRTIYVNNSDTPTNSVEVHESCLSYFCAAVDHLCTTHSNEVLSLSLPSTA